SHRVIDRPLAFLLRHFFECAQHLFEPRRHGRLDETSLLVLRHLVEPGSRQPPKARASPLFHRHGVYAVGQASDRPTSRFPPQLAQIRLLHVGAHLLGGHPRILGYAVTRQSQPPDHNDPDRAKDYRPPPMARHDLNLTHLTRLRYEIRPLSWRWRPMSALSGLQSSGHPLLSTGLPRIRHPS